MSRQFDPIMKVKGILGEHYQNYIVICVHEDAPNTLQLRTDNKYAAIGLVNQAFEVLKEITVDDGWEIVFDEDVDEEEEE